MQFKRQASKGFLLMLILSSLTKFSFTQTINADFSEKSHLNLIKTIYTEYSNAPGKLLFQNTSDIHEPSANQSNLNPADASLRESLKASLTPTGGGLFNFHSKENTRGSIYLLNDWVHGVVFDTAGHVISNSNLVFNYNKLNGDLLITKDLKSGLIIDRSLIAGFILLYPDNTVHIFTLLPSISNTLYCEVIGIGEKFGIFKLLTTKFIKANYQTDGMTSSGNNYDEYADSKSYFVVDLSNLSDNKFDLKKKSLKQAFAGNALADSFINEHSGDIDDVYLNRLSNVVNKN